MNIGQAARASGITAKMIRHYESVGLLPPAMRSDTGYRQYGEREVHVLRFIRRARDLGFSIKDISGLLSLWHDRQRPSRQVKALAQAHMQQLQRKIDELQSMRQTLEKLVQCCQGDERPDCPILADLADPAVALDTAVKKKAPRKKRHDAECTCDDAKSSASVQH